jgi:transporter family protein
MGLWFWIGVAFVSWGLASFFGKMVAPYFGAPYLVWIRSIITVFLLLPLVWAQRANSISITPTWQTWVLVVLVTSFTASAVIGFYNALRLGDASLVTPASGTYPVLTAILAVLFLGEQMSVTRGLGIFFAVVGIVFLTR